MTDLETDWLRRRAGYHPGRPALRFLDRTWSYAELDARTDGVAAALRARGVGPDDRVAVLAENHVGFVTLLAAMARTGAMLAPLNYRLATEELRELMGHVAPALLLAGPGWEARAEEIAGSVPVLPLEGFGQDSAPPQASVVGPDDVATLCFTGGTTGLPKGAMLTHRQLVMNAVNTAFGWGVHAEDAVVVATPMFHAAFHALCWPLLQLGGFVVVQERFDPEEHLALAAAHATLLFMVPTMFRLLADAPGFADADLGRIRWAISGGAPCPAPIREAFAGRGIRFKQGYGLTECGVNCFALELAEAAAHPESVGRPMPHLRARLVDDDGNDASEGELQLSGPVTMKGYFGRAEATAEAFVSAGGRRWLRTGDVARRDAEGRYFIVGRKKEMFISGGENVYPAEVERALDGHPKVHECAVVGVPDPRWGEVGLAAVVLHEGAGLDEAELRAWVAARLAKYKVPKRWRFLDALPKSGAGKVLKRALVE
ncbi:MAG: AMP-binding protein [Myxococcota bacterium]